VLEHHFNCHKYCNKWCPTKRWKKEDVLKKCSEILKQGKRHGTLWYLQFMGHYDRFTSEEAP
jgi:hypothetical protein